MMVKQEKIPFCPKRALISVSDKKNIVGLAKTLHKLGVEIIATGNTARLLRKNNCPVTDVSACTGFPEMLDGRVKTLHPVIHAGLLARGEQDAATLAEHNIGTIDLLIVNLYPFEQVINRSDCAFEKAIEHIDIGGPAMIRSAAKNHAHTYVIVQPDDYRELIQHLKNRQAPAQWSFDLAKKAFAHTAAYDAAISNYLGTLDDTHTPSSFPAVLTQQFVKNKNELRYGENPHQQAIFYTDKNPPPDALATSRLLQGKQLSYNNLLDADAALSCVKSFPTDYPTCVIVKHTNPCGIATRATLIEAYQHAFQADSISAFGGILAFNQALTADTAKEVLETQFVEVIIAPEVTRDALELLSSKPNIRVLETGQVQKNQGFRLGLRHINGGLLVQEQDTLELTTTDIQVVSKLQPHQSQLDDLFFAWKVVKHVKSNAIVYAKNLATLGIGGGQTSRVMSARIGLWQAEQFGFSTQGAVMASDAFIPFTDTLELAAGAGIAAVIQPGGSIRDQDMIDYADANQMIMVFTGMRHFKH